MSLRRNSKSDYEEIGEMSYSRLKNAVRTDEAKGDPQGVLTEMKARLEVLEAQYRAEHPEEFPG